MWTSTRGHRRSNSRGCMCKGGQQPDFLVIFINGYPPRQAGTAFRYLLFSRSVPVLFIIYVYTTEQHRTTRHAISCYFESCFGRSSDAHDSGLAIELLSRVTLKTIEDCGKVI